MILRESISVDSTESKPPSLSTSQNPFEWVSLNSLELLCSLLLSRVQAETILQGFVETQNVETLRIGALYRNLATHAHRKAYNGHALHKELKNRLQILLGAPLPSVFSITNLASKWGKEKQKTRSSSVVDVRIAATLLWSLTGRRGSWFRHLEEVLVADIHSLALIALGTNTANQPRIPLPHALEGEIR